MALPPLSIKTAWQNLISNWKPTDVDAATLQQFRFRQYHAAARLVPFRMAADCANALLICIIAKAALPTPLLAGWYICILAVAGSSTYVWWRWFRKGPLEGASPPPFILPIVLSAAMASLYAVAASTVFVHVDRDGQVVLVTLVAGLIAAGALGRATVPPCAFAWLAPLTLAAAYSIYQTSRDFSPFILILLTIYDVIVVLSMLSMSKMFLARLTAEATAAHQEQVVSLLLRDFETHASNWLWESDAHGRVSRVSARMSEVFGRPPTALLNVELYHLLSGTVLQRSEEASEITALKKRLATPTPFHNHTVPFNRGGEWRWVSLTAKPILDEQKKHTGWRGVGSDITEEHRYQMELQTLAKQDPLTGLPNRRHFLKILAERTAAGTPNALFLIDLDNFKTVNDTLGHSIGDKLLQMVSGRFLTCTTSDGLLARLDGDEFALLESGIDTAERALDRASVILQSLCDPFHIADTRTEIRASVGVALAPQHGDTTNFLLKNADAALYAAKELGGGEARLFDHTLGNQQQIRLEIISDLGYALKEQQFAVHYQPQVDCISGKITAFEALLRWHHPEKGLVPPDQFIPIAEETGQIISIGAWVLEQACRDASKWPEDLTVAVNLSAVQLNSSGIIKTVRHALDASGLPPRRLELEVTESALVQDATSAQATLRALRDMQIEIALDDFGTGYSMLSYLRNFPFDKLKIDRSFVMTLTDTLDDESRAIFRAIIDLASALDLRTVAEGIDSEEKLSAVRHYGCNDVQGYLVARPMEAEKVLQFLARWQAW